MKSEIRKTLPLSGRACAEMLAVTLLAFWSMIQLHAWWSPPVNSIVFAVMLGVTLPRALRRVDPGKLHFAVGLFAAGTAAAIGCGMLIENNNGLRIFGAVFFAAGVALPVWTRRFGEVWKASGTLFTMPFLAILVHPVPMGQNAGFFGWELVAAGVAFLWAALIKALGNATSAPVSDGETKPPSADKKPEKRKLLSSTKMALQLFVAVLAAFACAELIDAGNLVWPVITVLIVHSGNRGRGDILLKGVQRTAGALIGVAAASLIAVNLPAGDSMEIVAIFAILAVAAAVREFSYLYWAICIPAALVFLYSFFGQSGAELTAHLAYRLLGITIGSAVGIASGYFLLPIRASDVVRLRIGALLSAATDVAVSTARGEADKTALDRLAAADQELSRFDGVAKAAGYFGYGTARRLRGAVAGAHELADGLRDETTPLDHAGFAALAKEIGEAIADLSSKK